MPSPPASKINRPRSSGCSSSPPTPSPSTSSIAKRPCANSAPGTYPPSGSATVTIPDEPAPDFVAETIPDHRLLPPGQRPPGFEAVRARMRRHGRRTDAIERIKGEDSWDRETTKHRPRTRATEWITPRKAEKPWRRFVKAVEEERLPIGEPIFIGTIVEVCECSSQSVANIQADLVIEGAPYRMRRDGPTKATIVRAGGN